MTDLSILEEIQQELETKYQAHAKKEFDLALEYYNSIKPLLLRRDDFLISKQEEGFFTEFWTKAFLNYDVTDDMMPFINSELDLKWLKSFKVEYKENYVCNIRFELWPNEYVENEVLEKKMIIIDSEVESTKVIWKGNDKCALFKFFDSDECEYEVFDFFYEIYRNAWLYYTIEDE